MQTTFCSLVLALALSSCRRTQTPPARPLPTTESVAASADAASVSNPVRAFAPAAAPGEFRDSARIFPQNSLGVLTQSGPVVRSTGANLFQIIDGDAVSYQAYDVRSYAKTDYRVANSTMVASLSVYEFPSALSAYGRYSAALASNRDPSALASQAVSVGVAGFQGRTQLLFVKGPFLLQIDMQDDDESGDENALFAAARTHLLAIARAVETRIEGQHTLPAHPLASAGLVWGGATYIAEGAFGVNSTGPVWIGWYSNEAHKRYRVATTANASATVEAAHQLAQRFHRTGATAIANPEFDEAFAVTHEGEGELVVARKGARVVVIADGGFEGAESINRAEKTAAAIAQLQQAATVAPVLQAR